MSNPQWRAKYAFTVPGAGLTLSGALTTSGAVAAGSNVITLAAATTLTGTINAGDTFVINGITYTVLAAAVAAANAVTVTVSPSAAATISTGTTWSGYTVTTYAVIPSLASIGLVVTGAPTTSGSTPAGATSIALTAATSLTGSANPGSTFVISGVTYTVAGPATAAGNIVTVPIVGTVASTIAGGTAWTSYTTAFQLLPGMIYNAVAGPSYAGLVFGAAGNTSLLGITSILEAGFPTSAQVELWIFDWTATNPIAIASYTFGQVLNTAAGINANGAVPLASVAGVLVRLKGGNNAGTATVLVYAD